MSYTNETTYYGLPLPTGSDKSTWTDDNAAKERIDADLHSAVEMSTTASEDIVAIKATVANLLAADIQFQTDLDTANGKIDALQDKETLQDGEIAAVRADAEDMITAYNEPTATSTHAYTAGDYFIYNDVLYQATSSIAIGDTIVPDTNCTTTNVATELSQLNSDLTFTSENITLPPNWTGSASLKRMGNIGIVEFNAKCSNTINDGTEYPIFDIPSGFNTVITSWLFSHNTNSAAFVHRLFSDNTKVAFTQRHANLPADEYLAGSFILINV